MSDDSPFNPWFAATVGYYPDWLDTVAATIDRWVRDPEVLKHFQRQVLEWAYRRHDRTAEQGGFFPPRDLEPCEKYARLAVIHELVAKSDTKLNPWYHEDGIGPEGEEMCQAVCLVGLCWAFSGEGRFGWKDEHQRRIQWLLDDVERDLCEQGLLNKDQTKPKPDETIVGMEREAKVAGILSQYPNMKADHVAALIGEGMTGAKVRNTNAWKKREHLSTDGRPPDGYVKDGSLEAYDRDD